MIIHFIETQNIITIVVVVVFVIYIGFILISKNIFDKKNIKNIKNKNKQQEQKEIKNIHYVIEDLEKIFLDINKMIEEFKPSIGKYTMKDISKMANSKINKLIKSNLYKEVELLDESKEIMKLVNELKNRSPNQWKKYTDKISKLKNKQW